MGKQPYIPLYIGDWEQDLNCVSLEAEAAWLKLTFKLWKAPKRGLLSVCFSQMALLFKKSEEDTRKIFAELAKNGIFDYENQDENTVLIKSRRMLRDAQLSKVRSESGKQGGRPKSKEEKQSKSKTKAKPKQNPDIEYDNEDNKIECAFSENFQIKWKEWKEYRKVQFRVEFKSIKSEQAAIANLENISNRNESVALKIIQQSMANTWRGLFELKNGTATQAEVVLQAPKGGYS